jgi:hypothetical protein
MTNGEKMIYAAAFIVRLREFVLVRHTTEEIILGAAIDASRVIAMIREAEELIHGNSQASQLFREMFGDDVGTGEVSWDLDQSE